MQVAVKAAHEKQLEKDKEDREKREEQQRLKRQLLQQQQQLKQKQQQQLHLQLSPRSEPTSPRSKCSPYRNTAGILKAKNIQRSGVETVAKEKSRKAVKKAQQLQRKKALDKQLKDAKAKIVEEARSSSIRKDEVVVDAVKSKLLAAAAAAGSSSAMDCSSRLEGAMKRLNEMSAMNSTSTSTSTQKPSTVINLCDSNALKNLIKNSDTAAVKQPSPTAATAASPTAPTDGTAVSNSVTQNKHGPPPVGPPVAGTPAGTRRRPGSRIMKGSSTFLTNADGTCPCDLKAMIQCVQCEGYWHGDSINGEQLCEMCT